MSDGIVFNGPPPPMEQGPGAHILEDFYAELKKHPGEWGQLTARTFSATGARRRELIRRHPGVEATTRGLILYARLVDPS